MKLYLLKLSEFNSIFWTLLKTCLNFTKKILNATISIYSSASN